MTTTSTATQFFLILSPKPNLNPVNFWMNAPTHLQHNCFEEKLPQPQPQPQPQFLTNEQSQRNFFLKKYPQSQPESRYVSKDTPTRYFWKWQTQPNFSKNEHPNPYNNRIFRAKPPQIEVRHKYMFIPDFNTKSVYVSLKLKGVVP